MPEAAEAGGLHLTLTVRWLGGRPEMGPRRGGARTSAGASLGTPAAVRCGFGFPRPGQF